VFPAYHIVRRGDARVAFIGLVRNDVPPHRVGMGLRLIDPDGALKEALRALRGRADVIIVLAHMRPERMYGVALRHPEVDMVLGGRAVATSAPFELVNRAVVAYLGDEGCTVGQLDATFPPGHRPRAVGRVSLLNEDIAGDEAMQPLVARFRSAVGDGLPPGANWDPKMPCTSSFVGSEVCKLCHLKQFYSWQATDHAGAYIELLERGRQSDAECLACHATGFAMPGGYGPWAKKGRRPLAARVTQRPLQGVGCECCHGGARRHLGMALKDRFATAKSPQLRSLPAVRNCERCHTAIRPCVPVGAKDEFDMERYLGKIKHWKSMERPSAPDEGEPAAPPD
jgi:hypothetical protein